MVRVKREKEKEGDEGDTHLSSLVFVFSSILIFSPSFLYCERVPDGLVRRRPSQVSLSWAGERH